jgi:hypothetical protein
VCSSEEVVGNTTAATTTNKKASVSTHKQRKERVMVIIIIIIILLPNNAPASASRMSVIITGTASSVNASHFFSWNNQIESVSDASTVQQSVPNSMCSGLLLRASSRASSSSSGLSYLADTLVAEKLQRLPLVLRRHVRVVELDQLGDLAGQECNGHGMRVVLREVARGMEVGKVIAAKRRKGRAHRKTVRRRSSLDGINEGCAVVRYRACADDARDFVDGLRPTVVGQHCAR